MCVRERERESLTPMFWVSMSVELDHCLLGNDLTPCLPALAETEREGAS